MTFAQTLDATQGSIRIFSANQQFVVEISPYVDNTGSKYKIVVGKLQIEDMIDELTSTTCSELSLGEKIEQAVGLLANIKTFRE